MDRRNHVVGVAGVAGKEAKEQVIALDRIGLGTAVPVQIPAYCQQEIIVVLPKPPLPYRVRASLD